MFGKLCFLAVEFVWFPTFPDFFLVEKRHLSMFWADSDAPGVVDAARGFGVAKSLLRKTMDVIRGELPKVQAIWVHVISYNEPVT